MHNLDQDQSNKLRYTYFVCITAACIGLLFGLDIGVIAGALPDIQKAFALSPKLEGLVVSILLGGAVVGAFLSRYLARRYGRRNSLLICVTIYTIAALCSGFAPNYEILVVARFFLGIALGIAAFIAPIYLAEVAPESLRGRMVSLYQVMINVGIVCAYVSDTFFAANAEWRWMLGVIAVPSFIAGVCFLLLPRSPRWLVLQNRVREAKDVLMSMSPSKELVHRNLEEMKAMAKDNISSGLGVLKQVNFRRVLYLGLLLQMIQAYTGINVIVYYAPELYKAAGFASPMAQMYCTIAVGVVNMIVPMITARFVDQWGRRRIFFIGLTVITIGLLMETVAQYAPKTYFFAMMGFIASLIFIAGFAFSLGPVVWIICSEIFPLKSREVGMMFIVASNWFYTMIIGQLFPMVDSTFGLGPVFVFSTIIAIFGFFLIGCYTPETKGITLEEIEENLLSGKKLRHLGKQPNFNKQL